MYGSRCEHCGESRWSVLGRAAVLGPCPACGRQMVEERRHPGRRAARAITVERRDRPRAAALTPG